MKRKKTRKTKAARAAVYMLRVLGPVNCAKIALESNAGALVRIKIRLARFADRWPAHLVARIRRRADQLERAADCWAAFVARICAAEIEKAFKS